MRRLLVLLTITVAWQMTGLAVAAEWGNLSGRLVFDGTPPVPKEATITSDRDYCCKHKVIDESLLVNSKNKGIKNVIIFLYQDKKDKREVPIHDSYQTLAKSEVKLDNHLCRFAPHAVTVWTPQTFVVGNSDPIGHNTKIDTRYNPQSNATIPSGDTRKLNFSKAERLPVMVSCSIHPWMRAWLVIRDNPYMAVTDENGKFEIKNVPVGERSFMFWQERAGYVREVVVGGKSESWKRGVKTIDIKPGENSLGEIGVQSEIFE